MSEGEKVTIILAGIVVAILIIGLIEEADAEELVRKTQQQEQTLIFGKYPNPFPAFDYYEAKQKQSRALKASMVDPEPLPMYRLDDIKKIQCNSWEKIIGQIPFASGVLMSMAISEAQPHHVVIANYGYTGFVGYLHIPCNEETLGQYNVQFLLWQHPTVKDTHFIEDPLQINMKVEVTP